MNNAEKLCDLRFVKAAYRLARPTDQIPENFFDVMIDALTGGKHTFSIAENNGEQFAAELDVLAAIIRARIIRARVDSEEAE